ncbi:uncharacterized protein METZ01_LOCUS245223 [marine metagenome]|uniref:Uncharacterized protein n=1 Tax=marine metagenome TaxID=408172 RepID=A0A382HZ66_9ZZZZ
MPKLKALKQKKSKSMKKQTEDKIEKNNSDPDLDSEYQSLTNEQQVVQELCRLRDHFKKTEGFHNADIFPPLLYVSLRMFFESTTDLEKGRLMALDLLKDAVETEFGARNYLIKDKDNGTTVESFKSLIKTENTIIN